MSIHSESFEGSGSGAGGADTSVEAQEKQAEATRLALQQFNNKVLEERTKKPSIISKLKPAFGLFAANSLADEFVIIGALPNIPDGRPNALPEAAYHDENENDYMCIGVPQWGESGGNDYTESFDEVRLAFNGIPWRYAGEGFPGQQEMDPVEEARRGEPFKIPYPVDPATPFPAMVYITPKMLESLPDGVHRISYIVQNDQALNPDPSLAQFFTVDRVAPSNGVSPAALGVPADLPPSGEPHPVFDKEYLDSHPTIRFPVPPYVIARRGDSITILRGSDDAVLFTAPIWPNDAAARLESVEVPARVIEELGGGTNQLVYTLGDRIINRSGKSVGLNIEVRLQPIPSGLQAPLIASPIYRLHAAAGVDIGIPDYAGSLPTDEIIVSWGTPDNPRQLPPFPFSDGKTTVGWAFLSDPDARAVYEGRVTYQVRRNGELYGPSLPTTPQVDLNVAGPINPNDPDPVNPLLTPLVFKGGSGQSPNNNLTLLDKDKEVTIDFTVYTNAASGNIIHLFYDGTRVGDITLANQTSPQVIPVKVTWALLTSKGNGDYLAYYKVYENAAAAAIDKNPQQSINTMVRVTAVTTDLAAPYFVWFNGGNGTPAGRQGAAPGTPTPSTGVVNCGSSPWNGINLQLLDPQRLFRARDVVTVFFEYHRGSVGGAKFPEYTIVDNVVVPADPPPEKVAPAASRAFVQDPLSTSYTPGTTINIKVPYESSLFDQTTNPPEDRADSFVAYYTVQRKEDVYKSRAVLVKYNTRQGGLLCAAWVVASSR
ncbi:MAG: hypothetical protein ACN6P2_11495 [Pseudomonas palmensis]|uniref:hypothetical protein n=1 Tax=Pseudomonas palmensis TaxID=2815362 RepID=UPI003D0AC654